jgi:uncharacterized protein involved in response to NO
VFLAVVAREILASKKRANLPMLGALSLLLLGNLLVHLDALDLADTAELGNRIGLVTLLMLISLVGGRIIPSFTRNWLPKSRPEGFAAGTGETLRPCCAGCDRAGPVTRASLGHTGRPLSAGPATKAIYGLITAAALLRILAPLAGDQTERVLWLGGGAWSCAFGLFAVFDGLVLVRPRVRDAIATPI